MKERSFLQSTTKANYQISRLKFLDKNIAGSMTETELTMDTPRTFHKHFSGISNNSISHYEIKQHIFWKSSKHNASKYQEFENIRQEITDKYINRLSEPYGTYTEASRKVEIAGYIVMLRARNVYYVIYNIDQ